MINRSILTLIVITTFAILEANNGIHYIGYEDCNSTGDCPDVDERPWYYRQEMQIYGEDRDPTEELRNDTAWPGEREEFSDRLFNY